MTPDQETIRRQIARMVRESGLQLSTLARKAGLSPSTLTRFMNRPVNYVLSTATLMKLAAVCSAPELPDYQWLAAVGRRMRQTRIALAPGTSDETIAELIGWSVEEMTDIFNGRIEPRLGQFQAFANRMRVTADFLLSGKLDGLQRVAEARLLKVFPELLPEHLADIAPRRDTVRAGHKTDHQ